MTISTAIKAEIDRREMSVKELSNQSGVSYATLKRFISADHDISSKKLISILETLDVNLVEQISKGTQQSASQKELPSYLKKSLTKFMQGVQFGA